MGNVERLGQRAKKPAPERTAPIRSWSGLDPAYPETTPQPPGHSSAAGTEAAASQGVGDEGAAQEAAPGAVDSGYRVIEDYLSQGRAAAEQLGFGLSGGLATAGSFQALSASLFRDGLVWLEHLAKLAGNLDVSDGETRAEGPGGSEPVVKQTRLRVASRAPAEVDLRLYAEIPDEGLGVHPLRSVDSEAPPLGDVGVERSDGDWLLSVHVPDEQPPGLYTAVLFDRSDGTIRGTVAIRVGVGAPR